MPREELIRDLPFDTDAIMRSELVKYLKIKVVKKQEYQLHLITLDEPVHFPMIDVTSNKYILVTVKGFDVKQLFKKKNFDYNIELEITRKFLSIPGLNCPVISYGIHGE